MKKRAIALFAWVVFWLIFFLFARIFFIFLQGNRISEYSLADILSIFYHGFKLDLSATGYMLILPLLITIASINSDGRWYRNFIRIYTCILIVLSTILIVIDASVYSYWAYRLEFYVMGYFLDPGDAMASASSGQIFIYSTAASVIVALSIFIYNKLVDKYFVSLEKVKKIVHALIAGIIFSGLLIIPIRGGMSGPPISLSSVYFTDDLFPDHAAINIIWNLGNTAFKSNPKQNPYLFHKPDSAASDLSYLTSDSDSTTKVFKNKKPNIILIILESFGSSMTDQPESEALVTPRFGQLKKEGIYFSNIYSAGSRTDRALPALISGYPNIPSILIIRDSVKTRSLPSIAKSLRTAGYRSYFFYGGDIKFADIGSFLNTAGYDEIISKDNFSHELYNSKWGLQDNILFRVLSDSLDNFSEPFFCTALTLSSHEPFEVPMETVFRGKDEYSRFKNATCFTDMHLGEFIDRAKQSTWWDNTIVILIADHSRRISEKSQAYSEEIFRIPMLWIGGALAVRDSVITSPGNQYDLPYMLLNQEGIKSNFKFSKDLLSEGSRSFAFYTFNEGFAFITDSSRVVYDIRMKGSIMTTGINPGLAEKYGKSLLQSLFDDYLGR